MMVVGLCVLFLGSIDLRELRFVYPGAFATLFGAPFDNVAPRLQLQLDSFRECVHSPFDLVDCRDVERLHEIKWTSSLGAHRELILGRASSAAVRFDPRGDCQVGRHHARIIWDMSGLTSFVLADLGSRNGTYVNGRRVEEPVQLGHGDVVRLGTFGPEVAVAWEVSAESDSAIYPC